MKRSEIIRYLILRTIGNFLLLFAISGVTLTFGQALYQEALYRLINLRGVRFVVTDDKQKQSERVGFGQLLAKEGETIAITPVDADFGIVIPKINANARVLPNVDPSSYKEYMAALKLGVAHAAGTALPGMAGNTYFFAHSTDFFWNVGRYNAVFYLLKELEAGDEVDVFYNGRRFIYTVTDKKIVSSDDISYLTNSLDGEERLTLQTCWPPGTTIKRLLIIAKPKNAI